MQLGEYCWRAPRKGGFGFRWSADRSWDFVSPTRHAATRVQFSTFWPTGYENGPEHTAESVRSGKLRTGSRVGPNFSRLRGRTCGSESCSGDRANPSFSSFLHYAGTRARPPTGFTKERAAPSGHPRLSHPPHPPAPLP